MAGLNILAKLKLSAKSLIPVSTKMVSADNSRIEILGAVFLELTGRCPDGRNLSSKQMVYITPNTEDFYLSRKGCQDLGLVSSSFPTIGEAYNRPTQKTSAASQDTAEHQNQLAECGCPKRTTPPPIYKPPFALIDSNREQIEQFLLSHYSSSTFNTCTHQKLPVMKGPKMNLMVDKTVKPTAVQKAIPIPIHFVEQVKDDIDRDVRLGVIEKVPAGTPTTWCSRMVVCAKKNGSPRRTVDYQHVNRHALRETHSTPSPYNIARQVPRYVKKSMTDAWNGYHSIEIHKSDTHITSFITPWGRYRYLRCPQGYVASGDAYTSRYDIIVENVKNLAKIIDDSILWSETTEESFWQMANYLELCGTNGIILNKEKFQFAKDVVEFAGFTITRDSIAPTPTFLRSIETFPTPRNISDVRSWFGLINQAAYAFSRTDIMKPFRLLLKKNTKFEWSDDLETAFKAAKQEIMRQIHAGVKMFDINRTTCIATDWSKTGIGAYLLQKYCSCNSKKPFCCPDGWQLTLVSSRFLTDAESRYAPVEGEALAVVFGLDKCKHFILGCEDLTIAVDHRPLLGLFKKRGLNEISNPRLRNLKEKTLQYRFEMIHIDGVRNKVADCLSRHPSDPAVHLELSDDPTVHAVNEAAHMQIAAGGEPTPALTREIIAIHTATDMQDLLQMADEGFPEDIKDMPNDLKSYHRYRHEISATEDGIVKYKNRTIIPPRLRNHALQTLHSAHQGVSQMTSRAAECIFWPGITSHIQIKRESCVKCHTQAPSNPEAPPQLPTIPRYPFQQICIDMFSYKGISYIIIVDRYSGWPTVRKAQDGALGLIRTMKELINTFGIPEEVASDGGPELTAASFKNFLKEAGIHHRISSVAHPRSNGRAEVAVKSMKRLLTDNTGPQGNLDNISFIRAMLQYKNTPDVATGISPAKYLYHRPIRDFLPDLNIDTPDDLRDTISRHQEARKQHLGAPEPRLYEHTRRLPALKVADKVFVQNQTGPHPNRWSNTGTIVEVKQFDQYVVKMDHSGRHSIRNRKYLRPFLGRTHEILQEETTAPTPEPPSIPHEEGTENQNIQEDRDPTETPPATENPPRTESKHAKQTNPPATRLNETRKSHRDKRQPNRLQYTQLGHQAPPAT